MHISRGIVLLFAGAGLLCPCETSTQGELLCCVCVIVFVFHINSSIFFIQSALLKCTLAALLLPIFFFFFVQDCLCIFSFVQFSFFFFFCSSSPHISRSLTMRRTRNSSSLHGEAISLVNYACVAHIVSKLIVSPFCILAGTT